MSSNWSYLAFFLVLAFVSECLGSNKPEEKDRGWDWSAAAGLGVIIFIGCVGACLFSLVAWATCSLYTKCRRDRVSDVNVIKIGSSGSAPPPWAAQLVFKPEMATGFGIISDGFNRLGPSHIVRTRTGTFYSDGAKWAVGMTRGKHVYEITWPWGHRGYHAAVGVATDDAPIKCKGLMPLVGSNPKTWGLDIVKRKALHRNKPILTCPTDGSYVPDKFLMYVDMDEGTLGYGNEVTYWGEVITGLPPQGTQPVYLMIGASKFQSELTVVYRGSAPDPNDYIMAPGEHPHHLPPLYNVRPQAPPTYGDLANDWTTNRVMMQPAGPSHDVMFDPPPPYSQPQTGHNSHKDIV